VPELDHIVLASPSPVETRQLIVERTGVSLSAGGAHTGWGTRNWLAALGGGRYLELIGPDPDQPEPAARRPFGIDHLDDATLVTWCARDDDLDALRGRAAAAGLRLGAPFEMERGAPAGRLRWRLSLPEFDTAGGIVPFFIDWQDSVHPSTTSPEGLGLAGFGAEHPNPAAVRTVLDALGIELPLTVGPVPRLTATLRGPAGDLEITGPP
jgi:hypothetical protein